jgi:hypothetical protein
MPAEGTDAHATLLVESGATPVRRRPIRAVRRRAPLWQLVDFPASVGGSERAGREAALEAAGLLGAWLSPDGGLQSGADGKPTLDVQALLRGAGTAPLGAWLRAAVPEPTTIGFPRRSFIGSKACVVCRQPQSQRTLAFRDGSNGRSDADLFDLEDHRQRIAALIAIEEFAGELPAQFEPLCVVGPVVLGRPGDFLRRDDVLAPACAAQGLTLGATGDELTRCLHVTALGAPRRKDMKGRCERLRLGGCLLPSANRGGHRFDLTGPISEFRPH